MYDIFSILRTSLIWRENEIAVVTLLRVLARMSWWWKQVVKCKKFYHLAIGIQSVGAAYPKDNLEFKLFSYPVGTVSQIIQARQRKESFPTYPKHCC